MSNLIIEQKTISLLVSSYINGKSIKKLSAEFGINRNVIRNRLIKANVHIRNRSEAMYIRMKNTPPDIRKQLTIAAHIAKKGSHIPTSQLIIRAIQNQSKGILNTTEQLLFRMLQKQGFHITPQKAIGIYNCDLAINEPPIAIEIFGGHWHSYGRHAARMLRRSKQILNSGFSLIIIWVDALKYPLTIGSANYIISYAQKFSRNKSVRSQYRVILGNGNIAPTTKSYFNDPAFITTLHNPTG